MHSQRQANSLSETHTFITGMKYIYSCCQVHITSAIYI